MPAVSDRMVLDQELRSEWSVPVQRDGRRVVELLVCKCAYRLRSGMGIASQEVDSLSLVCPMMFLCMFGVHPSHGAPRHANNWPSGGNLRGQMDFNRVNASHMVNDHAHLTAVGWHHRTPLGIGKFLCVCR